MNRSAMESMKWIPLRSNVTKFGVPPGRNRENQHGLLAHSRSINIQRGRRFHSGDSRNVDAKCLVENVNGLISEAIVLGAHSHNLTPL